MQTWLPAPTGACLVCRVGAAPREMQQNLVLSILPMALFSLGLGHARSSPWCPHQDHSTVGCSVWASSFLFFLSEEPAQPYSKAPDVLSWWEAFTVTAALELGGFSDFSDVSVPGRGSLNTSVVWLCQALYLGSR